MVEGLSGGGVKNGRLFRICFESSGCGISHEIAASVPEDGGFDDLKVFEGGWFYFHY